ncbi:MAG: corrinoid protein [Planctomycetota bacterium]|nr:corrinoid protein [Planctomycetota bacterium]
MSSEAIFEQLRDAVLNGKRKDAVKLCEDGLKAGVAGKDLLTRGLLVGMEEVGRRMRSEEYFIPEVLVGARAMQSALEVIREDLAQNPAAQVGRVVIGTVSGDLHDIGKNLVAIMLTGAGFEVIDLGIDVTPARFVSTALERKADAVAMSALLTTTMVNMKEVVDELRKAHFEGKVVIGGAPVTQEFADKIGADLYAGDASEGAEKLKALLQAA